MSAESLTQLQALLARHFAVIDVVVYLRRWDRMALGFHATTARNAPAPAFRFDRYAGSGLLDYPTLRDR